MREQAVEAVVFGAGGVRYRGLADSEGLGSAATAVDVCSQARDGLGLTGLVGAAEARAAAEARS